MQASFFPSASKVTVSTGAGSGAEEPIASASAIERGASDTTESSGVVVLAESDTHEGTSVSIVVERHDDEVNAEGASPATNPVKNEAESGETLKQGELNGASDVPPAKEHENPVSPTSPTEGAPIEIIQTPPDGGLQLPPSGPNGVESAPPPPPPGIDPSRRDVHTGIGCDGCEKSPIVGTRWKCLICENYDLCDECRSSGTASKGHSVDHRMLRMRTREGEDLLSKTEKSLKLITHSCFV